MSRTVGGGRGGGGRRLLAMDVSQRGRLDDRSKRDAGFVSISPQS